MRILCIIAQKPSSTGSGVYLSELVRCFKEMGHEQEIICAVYESDNVGAKQCEPAFVGAKHQEPASVGVNACGASVGKDIKHPLIYGICHNTDLRQYQQTDLKRDFIKENIAKLDKLFFPS